jgi:hypothetical protein
MDRETLAWVLGALLVVAGVAVYLWFSAEPQNPLRDVYGVM